LLFASLMVSDHVTQW